MDELSQMETNIMVPVSFRCFNLQKDTTEIFRYMIEQNDFQRAANRITIDYSKDDYRDMLITRQAISNKSKPKKGNKTKQVARII